MWLLRTDYSFGINNPTAQDNIVPDINIDLFDKTDISDSA